MARTSPDSDRQDVIGSAESLARRPHPRKPVRPQPGPTERSTPTSNEEISSRSRSSTSKLSVRRLVDTIKRPFSWTHNKVKACFLPHDYLFDHEPHNEISSEQLGAEPTLASSLAATPGTGQLAASSGNTPPPPPPGSPPSLQSPSQSIPQPPAEYHLHIWTDGSRREGTSKSDQYGGGGMAYFHGGRVHGRAFILEKHSSTAYIELTAVLQALKWVVRHPWFQNINSVTIWTDNQSNADVLSGDSTVSDVNKPIMRKIKEEEKSLELNLDSNFEVFYKFEHRSTHPGNDCADLLAGYAAEEAVAYRQPWDEDDPLTEDDPPAVVSSNAWQAHIGAWLTVV